MDHQDAAYSYLLVGSVLPKRAAIEDAQFSDRCKHIATGSEFDIGVKIIHSEIAVRVHTNTAWNLHDLRNTALFFVESRLAMVGFLLGRAYQVEITRVFEPKLGVDYVFGIEIECIRKVSNKREFSEQLRMLEGLTRQPHGLLIIRSLTDLRSAMQHSEDTAFYCYRALESLRLHCCAVHQIDRDDKSAQWDKFRKITGCDRNDLFALRDGATPVRHGDNATVTDADRAQMFGLAWKIADDYLAAAAVNSNN